MECINREDVQVYFPPGTYLVSGSIIDYYYTQIIGNPKCLPVIKGASNFNARWIIDGDQVRYSTQTVIGVRFQKADPM